MKVCIRVFVVLAIFLLFAEVSSAQTDVVIAIDLSKSMQINDPGNNRFTGADVFLTMFSVYGTNRGGVVAFGNDASDIIKLEYLSFDQAGKHKPILEQLGSEDWTELGKGLDRSKIMLGSSERRRSIILISDGKVEGNPHSRGVSPEQARDQANRELWATIVPSLKSANISVYTIGLFQNNQGDEPTLQKIAHETGGFYTHVENPQEFPLIYKRMLDDIDQPSGVAELTTERNSIVLTPFDQGVIIYGPTRFVVKAPNSMAYTTDKQTTDTPVKQRFFEYNNNTAILFLGRPDNIEQNGEFWNGKWSVQELKGKGEATFISNVRMDRDPNLPLRREFFLNEYYPIEYQFQTQPGFDAEGILSKCRAEFVLVPQGQSKAKPVLGTIGRQGSVFKGESLLDNDGDYVFEIKIFYQDGDSERWTRRDRFHVNKTPLVALTSPGGLAQVGSKFRIEAKEDATESTGYSAEMRGLVDSLMTYSLRYGSDTPIALKPTSPDSAGIYRSEELEFRKAGNLEIEGVLNGKLLMQLPVENGEPMLKPYKVKARVFRKLTVENSWWGMTWRKLLPWFLTGLSLLASVLGIFGYMGLYVQRPKFNRLDRATLIGQGRGVSAISLKPAGLSNRWRKARWFTRRSAVSVGGPQSNADIKDPRLSSVKGRSVMEISVNSEGKYHITSNGALDVYLNNNLLEPNEPQPINPRDEVLIPDVGSFKFFN